MHPFLAFLCFFRVLFGRSLPRDALAFLPEGYKALPPSEEPEAKPAPEGEAKAKDKGKAPEAVAEQAPEKVAEKPKAGVVQHQRDGALAMLALLQREGRLVDFLRDSVDGADDADIGAAAREVHRGCRKVLDQVLTIEPVMPGAEEARVSVPKGFDPAEIRLIGEARGDAPYQGTLRHHGWRVVDAKLPTLTDGVDRTILAPAEVEL
jgi:hypothetical protein